MNKIVSASAFRRSRMQLVSGLLAAIAILVMPDMGIGQNDAQRLVINAPEDVRESSSRKLNKIISVELDNIPLEEALQFVADKEELELVYSKNLVLADWNRNISVRFPEATVLGALYGILEKSGRDDLRLVLSDHNHLVIVQNGAIEPNPNTSIVSTPPVRSTTGSGTIFGEVREAGTGETLPGANVLIRGTSLGSATDVDGRFVLRRIPEGDHILVVRFMGYLTQELPITVVDNERVEVNVEMVGDFIEGDEVYVVARQRGQARSLTLQRQSVNIRSVVSSEQMDRFADVSVEGSLQRIAGMGHGGANIRGVGRGSSTITLDGQRMGSTGGADRTVDLSTISADMVQQLEVIKVITPDMNADALSGVINISTRRPIGGDRTLNARLGGGYNSRFLGQVGPIMRSSLSYGDSPSNRFSYGVNFSYQRDTPASEWVRTNWTLRNFEEIEGVSEVLNNLRSEMQFDPRDRFGAGMQFTMQPTERTTYHVQLNFNYQISRREQHGMSWEPQNYITPFETGDIGQPNNPGRNGDLRYNTQLRDANIYQYTSQVGARHRFDHFDMEYKLGWGHGRQIQDTYDVQFRGGNRHAYMVSYDKGVLQPELEFTTRGSRHHFPFLRQFDFQGVDQRWSFNKDNEFTGTLDFDVPFSKGSLKFGTSALMTFKDGFSERYNNNFERVMSLQDFDRFIKADYRVFDRQHQTYHLPFIVDLHAIRDWYHTNRPHFDMNRETWAIEAETSFYDAYEHTFGTYGMGRYNLGRFTLFGGLRVEHTMVNYNARSGVIGHEGEFWGAVDTTASNNYTNLFPNAQVVYALGRMANLRFAYSRSIGRPTLDQLSPFFLRNYSNETLRHGNPNLEPMLSNNLDIMFEYYFMNVGQFTIGLYYKEMRDFVYRYTEVIRPGENIDENLFSGWRRSTFLNGDEAMVYGIEVAWQQNLDFLPGFLGNLGTYANYSYSYSEADAGRTEKTRLQDHRPHVVNAGLDYSQGSFSSQISYRWGSPSISSYGDLRAVPAIPDHPRNLLVHFDQYRDAANDLSLTLRYRLTDNFRLWADATNMLNHRSVSYFYNREYYPYTQTLNGRTVSFGIRYTF